MKKILAIKIRAMGDTVLLTAPLAELRRAYPDAEIHVLVDRCWAPLLEHSPVANRIWGLERRATRLGRLQTLSSLARQLRRERFDLVINFHASTSSAFLSRATGAQVRSIHFHGLKDPNLFSTVPVPGKGQVKPIIERDMDALRALGLSIPEGVYPKLAVTEDEKSRALAHLASIHLTGPVLGLGLGASRPSKAWPLSNFVELGLRWCQEKNGSVFALVGPNELALAQEFRELLKHCAPTELQNRIHIEAGLGLRELTGMIQRFSVFAGNDSGPRHLAVAVGVPTVTLFGPEHPYEWHPYRTDVHPYFFSDRLTCRTSGINGERPWCGAAECPQTASAHQLCMTSIDVTAVLGECSRIANKEDQ